MIGQFCKEVHSCFAIGFAFCKSGRGPPGAARACDAAATLGCWRGWRAGCCSRAPTLYTVNLLSDTGASSGTDDYPTAGTPSGDLRYCITQANANTNPLGSRILFDPTVFNPNFNGSELIALSSTLELSETAGPEMIEGLVRTNPPPEPLANTTVSIGDNSAIQVLTVDPGVTATLSGLTVTSAPNYAGDKGGIVNASGATLTVTNCNIQDNGFVRGRRRQHPESWHDDGHGQFHLGRSGKRHDSHERRYHQ